MSLIRNTKINLQELSLFRGVSMDAIEAHLEQCSEIRFAAGERLLTSHAANDKLYLILDGALRVDLIEEGSHTLVELGPGECVGEMSIINRDDASADVVAIRDSRLLVIPEEMLWSMVNSSHGVARNLLYILSKRLKAGNERLLVSLEEQRRFEQFATVDALTGLYNRRWLDTNLARQIERCRKDEIAVSLIMMDVDHFKQFNDAHGHLAGDRALATVADVIRNNLRPTDTAARYGGEEFVILLVDVSMREAEIVAERLRRQLGATPIRVDGVADPVRVTGSFGVACLPGAFAVRELINAADRALYRAKEAGRNRVSQ